MKTFFSFLLAVSVSLLSMDLTAQEISGKIDGYTVDKKTGDTLTFVSLTLTDAAGIVANTQSDLFGHYSFSNLAPGSFKLEANLPGYAKTKSTNVVVVKGKTTSLTLSLAPVEVKEEEISTLLSEPDNSYKRVDKCDAYSGGSTSNGLYYYQPDVVHNTESYTAIEENGFRNCSVNPLSTFSVDVDAASYSNVRRFIIQGQKPPVDAVRIEEMINYFDYDYPDPADGVPFSITTEIGDCPWNENSKLVHIGLQGQRIDTKDLPANNLVFLIDVSGSMATENKLPLLIKSFELLVSELREEDKIAIVVYAGAAGVVLESTSVAHANKAKILESLQNLKAGGSTAGGQGIQLAYKVAADNFIKDGNNRVILATDGDFNVGMSSDAEMQRLIEEKRESGIYLTCLGFGMGNYQDSKLEILADKGNGNYAYIDNLLEAKKVLVTEMGGTLLTLAKDVKIQVEFNPMNIESYRLVGYENRLLNEEDFNNDKKDAGEIGAGHSVTALYEVVLKGTGVGPSVDPMRYSNNELNQSALVNEMLTVKFRYKKPGEEVSLLIEKNLENKVMAWDELSDNFKFSAAVSAYGMLIRNSEFKGTANFDSVLELAKNSKGNDKNGYRAEFIRIVELSKSLYTEAIVKE
jgi:Ca-activated chloride channel homolog